MVQFGLSGLRLEIEAYDALVEFARMNSVSQAGEFLGKLNQGRRQLGKGGFKMALLIAPSQRKDQLFGRCILTKRQQESIRAILGNPIESDEASNSKVHWEDVGVVAILAALRSDSVKMSRHNAVDLRFLEEMDN